LACRSRVAQPPGAPPDADGTDDATARSDTDSAGPDDDAVEDDAEAGAEDEEDDDEAEEAGGAEDDPPDEEHPAAAATAPPTAITPITRSASEAELAITIPPHRDPTLRSPRPYTYDDVACGGCGWREITPLHEGGSRAL